jgi:TonB family protein
MSLRRIRMMVALMALTIVVPAATALAAPQTPVRVGGVIREPRKIKDVKPVYPDDAREAKVQGMVILEVVIGKDGSVTGAKVLRPVPLLEQAALDAVGQWKYEPTQLDGEPVEVLMVVTVNFVLNSPVAAPAEPKPPVRVGGSIKEPKRISWVAPVYPKIAMEAKVQGTVIIEALIDTDGSVVDAKVLRSVPLLEDAALESVKQWMYEPTLVDGEPVRVVLTVTVSFTLK